jgi:hypothetical protein
MVDDIDILMFNLYDEETEFLNMVMSKAPADDIEKQRGVVRDLWKKAKGLIDPDRFLDSCDETAQCVAFYDTCRAYRNICKHWCGKEDRYSPCQHAKGMSECGPFCPHFTRT